MNLAQLGSRGKDASAEQAVQAAGADRSLTLLAEGAALNMPDVDPEIYKGFRGKVSTLAMQMPDRLPESEKLLYIRTIVKEFENYRGVTETMLRNRQIGWRTLVSALLNELLANLGIDSVSPTALPLVNKVSNLSTAEEIESYSAWVHEFLHPGGAAAPAAAGHAASLRTADRSTANDNAAGLRGGGAAVDHVKRVKQGGGKGFVALFRLSFLDVISERFGMEAVEDCIMAVSAYLTQSLRSGDAVYHWSDSSLLGVLENRANQQIATAELGRIVSQNREITISVSKRAVMLRIPIEFELIPIDRLQNAEDLLRISGNKAVKW